MTPTTRSTVAGPVQSDTVRSGRITRARKTPNKKGPIEPLAKALRLRIKKPSLELGPVSGNPPAWSEKRPDLCDAIPWFRATQGGLYHLNGFCWGFLVDSDSGERAYIDEEIIITRVGGGCTKDKDGNLTLIRDQDFTNVTVKSLLNNQQFRNPVGVVIGSRNKELKRKLPHRYNVMAYFKVTDVWYERVGEKTGVKVRFEKLDLSEKSWWAARGSPNPKPLGERDFDTKPESVQCPSCHLKSPRIYNEGWMCLKPTCTDFWCINQNRPDALTFHPDFLNTRSRSERTMQPHHSLVPNLLGTISEDDPEVSSMRIAWKAIVCPLCSKCIPRMFWRGWKCTDDTIASPQHHCSFQKLFTMPPVSIRSVVDDFDLGPIQRALYFNPKRAIPEIDDESLFPYRKLTYRIRGVGSITHFVANRAINSQYGGPNDMFTALQCGDLGLRRYRLQQSVVAGTLTAHFAVNFGMPYKYVVSVASKGFDEAPEPVLRALGRLTWATEQAVSSAGDHFLPPNELLVLGYFEDMKIGFHDDGESSLGPTIATLSLGAPSTMSIRMKYKYYHGLTRAKHLVDNDPTLEGCKHEEGRLDLKKQLDAGKISQSHYKERLYDLLKVGTTAGGEAPPRMRLELHHGDLVVMHGENLQSYFEHAVVPENKMRFALTARYIKPDHVNENELYKGQFTLSPDQIYNGQ
ncbi:hypothetical protein N7474_001904 [Penicillium riverlandense]|uniref:uncharacterized protein n=1 Tax=Penicillium riverlandense TaxID=1903569 RepID=UPI0025498AF5|nr:uncharacterized protein N7474_001904 [Penicillium riverlandense]KAJ5833593.1 hypothetical protein N7474_001904 [Penicillium riverlandense]